MDVQRYLAHFERPGYSFGEWPERQRVGLVLELPSSPVLSPEADALVRDLYASGFILRDSEWPRWRAEAQRFRDEPVAADLADEDAIRRFFTVALRTDYGMPGFLLQVLREGTVTRLLRRLRDLRSG